MFHLAQINIESTNTLSGGLEMLFDNETKHKITMPSKEADGSAVTIASLIRYLCDNVMRDSRKELFVLEGCM